MEKAIEAVGEELAVNSQMYLGHHGHILTFPIEKGKTMNVVAFRSMDGEWTDEKWVLPMKREDMVKDYEGWGAHVSKILPLMEKPDIWALFDHPAAPTYYKKRFAMLGDAAHASTPHQGAGAGQAIEDAYVLSSLLGEINSVDDIEKAFKAYDTIRRPRSQRVVTTSRDAARIYEFEDENLGSDLEKIRETLGERFKWIWDEDMVAQKDKALQLLRDEGVKVEL
ncbi:putative Salicylate hydroxylase [Glarea lozoyensis 74030]|nr:putative Salicylate hydroxylase [Glarea lozoyensis 74030]